MLVEVEVLIFVGMESSRMVRVCYGGFDCGLLVSR